MHFTSIAAPPASQAAHLVSFSNRRATDTLLPPSGVSGVMKTPILGRAPPLAGVPKFAWASSLVQRLKTRSPQKVSIRSLFAAGACPTARQAGPGAQILKHSAWLSVHAARCAMVHSHSHLFSCVSGSSVASWPANNDERP
jgi:hypothetical protein